ncbi:MAG TPA: hypothetical protein VIM65_01865 [Cyclobacteriaceae bacterium]
MTDVKRKLVLITLCGLLTASCAVIKDTPRGQLTKLEKSDFEKLNGQFSNYPTISDGVIEKSMASTDFEPLTLWSQIDGLKEYGEEKDFEKQTVTFDFISGKKGIAKLWDNGELKKTKKIRGKIKGGYFYRRPYFVAIPLIPLIFGYKTYTYRIGINGNLMVVDYRWNYWGFAIASGSYERGQSNSSFVRK